MSVLSLARRVSVLNVCTFNDTNACGFILLNTKLWILKVFMFYCLLSIYKYITRLQKH